MKRFYNDVTLAAGDDGWRILLDGRAVRTQGGAAQVVPTEELAERMAREWRDQGEEIDPRSFFHRDLADLAIDVVRPERAGAIAKLLEYAETDTLCYRADPTHPLYRRQSELWEPLLTACEARHGIAFERVSGIVHRQQPAASLATLRARLEQEDSFTLAPLSTLASLAASLVVALAVLDRPGNAVALFAAANCEEDWQAELWGWDYEAERTRKLREEAFARAAQFLAAARA